jgi:hypothetical protein
VPDLLHFPLPLLAEVAGAVIGVAIIARTAWAQEPLVVRRGHVVGAALTVGCLSGAGIIVGTNALRNLDREREARAQAIVQSERRRTEARTLDRAQVSALARRIARQEQPSTADLLRLIRRAARACEAQPARCATARAAFGAGATRATAPVAPVPAARHDRPDRPATAPQSPHSGAGRPDRPLPPLPPAGGSSSPAAPGPPPAAPAPPVTVSPPPSLPLPCVGLTTPVVGVACP